MAAKKVTPIKFSKKTHLLEIRQRRGSKGVMVGANTELFLDGKRVKGARSVSLEVDAKGVAQATIVLIGRFKVSGKVKTNKIKLYK